jgi:phosphoribosylformimino-5-aminoimidazole carboxamide ribotide isomerase
VIVVPAIDLLEGRAVRLREGKRDQATIYREIPEELVDEFARDGASRVHIVDLDGAFAGKPAQVHIIKRILARTSLPVHVGGGIRSEADIKAILDAGARWAVLGTAAVKDPAFVEKACKTFADRVIIAVDARDGRVAVEGWTVASDVDAVELAQRAVGWGAAKILYTDVSRDGLRGGPNVAATARLQAALGSVPVIASGGIGALQDLKDLHAAGVLECVVGRAIYDQVFTVAEAVKAC